MGVVCTALSCNNAARDGSTIARADTAAVSTDSMATREDSGWAMLPFTKTDSVRSEGVV